MHPVSFPSLRAHSRDRFKWFEGTGCSRNGAVHLGSALGVRRIFRLYTCLLSQGNQSVDIRALRDIVLEKCINPHSLVPVPAFAFLVQQLGVFEALYLSGPESFIFGFK